MTEYFHEVRTDVVRAGPPIIVKVGDIIPPSVFNFRSTFDYPTEVAQRITNAGNTAGLKGLPVSCVCIYIDVDENREVATVRGLLKEMGITFEEYQTGNRGCHFHIPLASRLSGTNVIYTVTDWLKRMEIWHLIDTTVYREGGQFRMESATHAKTGKPKILVEETDGKLLELELKVKPPEAPLESRQTGSKREFFMNLMLNRGIGQRHMHMYILWKSGLAAGLAEQEVREAIHGWNERQDYSHPPTIVDIKLDDFSRKERVCTQRY